MARAQGYNRIARVMHHAEGCDHGSDAEVDDTNEMIMEKQVVIKLPGCKKSWIPDYKEIGDRVFIKVSKWDRVFSQWIVGKAIMFGKKDTTITCPFWEDLVKEARQASITAAEKARQEAAMDEDDDEQTRKRKKQLSKISNADGGLTPVIKVTVGGRMVNALFNVSRESTVWLEYSPATLFSLKGDILCSKEAKVPSPKKSPRKRRGRKPKE